MLFRSGSIRNTGSVSARGCCCRGLRGWWERECLCACVCVCVCVKEGDREMIGQGKRERADEELA